MRTPRVTKPWCRFRVENKVFNNMLFQVDVLKDFSEDMVRQPSLIFVFRTGFQETVHPIVPKANDETCLS